MLQLAFPRSWASNETHLCSPVQEMVKTKTAISRLPFRERVIFQAKKRKIQQKRAIFELVLTQRMRIRNPQIILRISLLSKFDLLLNGEKVFGEHTVNLYLTLFFSIRQIKFGLSWFRTMFFHKRTTIRQVYRKTPRLLILTHSVFTISVGKLATAF